LDADTLGAFFTAVLPDGGVVFAGGFFGTSGARTAVALTSVFVAPVADTFLSCDFTARDSLFPIEGIEASERAIAIDVVSTL
jgi:hypothetical protein